MSGVSPAREPQGGVREADSEDDYWTKASDEAREVKTLERVNGYKQAVIGSITTVGALLTGLGAITASVALDRDTRYVTIGGHEVPLVPAGALLTAVFGSVAVIVALISKAPKFEEINYYDNNEVKRWFTSQVAQNKWPVRISSWLIVIAAVIAAATSICAGVIAIEDGTSGRSNHAMLSLTTGEKVTGHLGGTIDGLADGDALQVEVHEEPTAGKPLATLLAMPDKDGVVTFDVTIAPVSAGSGLVATIRFGTLDEKGVFTEGAALPLLVRASAPAPPIRAAKPSSPPTK